MNFRADLRRLLHEQPAGATALRALDTALRCALSDVIVQEKHAMSPLARSAERHAFQHVVLDEVAKPWSWTA